jgi:translation initiation factor 2A
LKKVASFKEDAAVYCEFLPDGIHILTATLSPRLRVDNRFRVRSYSGDIVWEKNFKELFQVRI